MTPRLALLFFLPLFGTAQNYTTLPVKEKEAMYCEVLYAFVDSVYKKDKAEIDTLFVVSSPEFPETGLPEHLQNTNIVMLPKAKAEAKFKYRAAISLIDFVEQHDRENGVELLFISYLVNKTVERINYWPKRNGRAEFVYNPGKKMFELSKLSIEAP